MDGVAENRYKSNMANVEDYNLYGEKNDFPDVLHCETIETRSLLHDWEFAPHRHRRLHQFILIAEGGGEVILDGNRRQIRTGDLINVPIGVIHGFSFLPGTQGWVVTLAAELLEQSMKETEGLRPHLRKTRIAKFGPDIHGLIRAAFSEYPARAFARAHVLRAYAGALTGLVARAIAAGDPHGGQVEHPLLGQFEAHLDEHFASHLTVTDYAAMLGVTPTHLSRVLRAASGLSAQAAIEARLIREARRHLAFSNLRISEIAYQLGFSDPAYFSRVFRRATGLAPRDFRSQLDQ